MARRPTTHDLWTGVQCHVQESLCPRMRIGADPKPRHPVDRTDDAWDRFPPLPQTP